VVFLKVLAISINLVARALESSPASLSGDVAFAIQDIREAHEAWLAKLQEKPKEEPDA